MSGRATPRNPRRILHLVSTPLYSGALPPTLGLALAQRTAGCQVWLAYDTKRGGFSDYEEPAAPLLEPHALQPQTPLVLSSKSSPAEILRDVRRLRQLLFKNDIHVLHCHLSHDHVLGHWAARASSTVVVRTLHSARSLQSRLGQRWLNRRAHGVLVRSEAHLVMLRRRFAVSPGRSECIPGGIDSAHFRPFTPEQRQAAREHLGLPSEALVVGNVGLMAGRGQEELLEAARQSAMPQLHVLLVGRGGREQALRAQAEAAGLAKRVHFTGYLGREALPAAYAAMDAAFCAQAGNDGSARAVLEAMACGLPVLGVAVEAIGELVQQGGGVALRSRAPADVAPALQWLAHNPDAAHALGQAGRSLVLSERTHAHEAARTLNFYARLRRVGGAEAAADTGNG